jgi:phage shock protein A
MASLMRAIGNWFREKKDEAAESISDPVRDAKYDIEDSQTQTKEFESKIQALMKANNNLKKDRQDSGEEVKKWDGLARRAAAAGNRDDVQSCVAKRQTAQGEFEQYAKDITANDKTIAELRAQLGKARNKIAKAKSNTAVLSARMSSAKLRTNLAAGARGLGDGPLSRLDTLENAVRNAESDAEAWEELHTDDVEDLEEKYGSGDANVDEEVAKLMAEAE